MLNLSDAIKEVDTNEKNKPNKNKPKNRKIIVRNVSSSGNIHKLRNF